MPALNTYDFFPSSLSNCLFLTMDFITMRRFLTLSQMGFQKFFELLDLIPVKFFIS